MPLTPEEIPKKKFTVVHRRGYDRSEVEQYLELVAKDYNAAIERIAAAAGGGTTEEDIASEIAEILRTARDAARRMKNKARAEADRMIAQAEAEAGTKIEEAESKRDDLLQRADAEAKNKIAASERQKSAFVELIQQRYGELLKHEKQLRSRIDGLEKLVTELRVVLEPVEQIDLQDDSVLIGMLEDDDQVPRSESLKGPRVTIQDLQRQARARLGGDEKGS